MVTKHLTEEELQEFVFEKETCAADIIEHVEQCNICEENAKRYLHLFNDVKETPTPFFDFNVADSILSKLPEATKSSGIEKQIYWGISMVLLLVGGAIIYLFWDYISSITISITSFSVYMIIISAVITGFVLVLDIYQRFNKINRELDLS